MNIFEMPFLYQALAVGLIVALLTGLLSVVVVIRRMSFFSDAIGHAALTGIALGLLWQLDPLFSAIFFSILIGIGIAFLNKKNSLSLDTIIGVFYSAAVALGVIIISSLKDIKIDLVGLLFGDILGAGAQDILIALILAVLIIIALAFIFNGLARLALSKDLARVHGVKVDLIEFLFMILLATTVAVGIKLVGIILIGPMLIMPAAIAKNLSRSLLAMITISVAGALAGVLLGFIVSIYFNIPTGPSIVLSMAILFAASLVARSFRKRV